MTTGPRARRSPKREKSPKRPPRMIKLPGKREHPLRKLSLKRKLPCKREHPLRKLSLKKALEVIVRKAEMKWSTAETSRSRSATDVTILSNRLSRTAKTSSAETLTNTRKTSMRPTKCAETELKMLSRTVKEPTKPCLKSRSTATTGRTTIR